MRRNAEHRPSAIVGGYPTLKAGSGRARGRQLLRLGALAATCLSWATPSLADAEIWAPGAGLFVGYSFGKAQGLQVGLEAFALGRVGDARYQQCGSRWTGAAFGPLAQLSLVGGFHPQITLGAREALSWPGARRGRHDGRPNAAAQLV